MRVKDLQTVAERKKNETEISTRAFPLESPSTKSSHLLFNNGTQVFLDNVTTRVAWMCSRVEDKNACKCVYSWTVHVTKICVIDYLQAPWN